MTLYKLTADSGEVNTVIKFGMILLKLIHDDEIPRFLDTRFMLLNTE